MIAALLLASAVPPVETAERAFASAAQIDGQWTAFRRFAAPDAQLLADGPQPAAVALKDLPDPPSAVMWWPARTITSCDGSLAFSTGPWVRKGGRSNGHYFTIWRHDTSGWHWIFDGGASDHKPSPAGDTVKAVRAACSPATPAEPMSGAAAGGASRDGSLHWRLEKADGDSFNLVVTYRAGRNWKTERAIVG
jgi:hypothetical protein